jgi:four helix bundle protein
MTSSFQDLEAWKAAHSFVLLVYHTTENFPKSEQYGLTSQFRRASVSIAANIVEGYRKKGKADKLRFYNIAQGSTEESYYFIILSFDLKYIDEKQKNELLSKIDIARKLLNGYYNAISKSR